VVPGAPQREQRQKRGGANAGQRDIAADGKQQQPDQQQNDNGGGHQRDDHPGRSGNALATLEANPGRVVVTEDGTQPGEHLHELGEDLLVTGQDLRVGQQKGHDHAGWLALEADPIDSQQRGDEAFEHIQQQAGDAKFFAHDPQHIGGTDVAGAVLADVDPAGLGHEQAEWNRT